MFYFILKTIITALLIALISTIAQKSTFWGGILASIPVTSVLAILWLWKDTMDKSKVSSLTCSIFWMVLPSLVFFVMLPWLLKSRLSFGWAMTLSLFVTMVCYFVVIFLIRKAGVVI